MSAKQIFFIVKVFFKSFYDNLGGPAKNPTENQFAVINIQVRRRKSGGLLLRQKPGSFSLRFVERSRRKTF